MTLRLSENGNDWLAPLVFRAAFMRLLTLIKHTCVSTVTKITMVCVIFKISYLHSLLLAYLTVLVGSIDMLNVTLLFSKIIHTL